MICIGHRGARGHEPENTLLSVRRGIELGATWIEVDVRAAGETLAVIHDERLDRTTDGSGLVAGKSLAELRRLDAGKGERIPTLQEVLDVTSERIGLVIELKDRAGGPLVCDLLAARFASGWPAERIIVSSFDHRALAEVRRRLPAARFGPLIVGLPVTNAEFAEQLGAFSVHPSVDFIDEEFVADAHRRGLLVHAFTANHRDDIDRMRRLGVDGVFTDYPERVAAPER